MLKATFKRRTIRKKELRMKKRKVHRTAKPIICLLAVCCILILSVMSGSALDSRCVRFTVQQDLNTTLPDADNTFEHSLAPLDYGTPIPSASENGGNRFSVSGSDTLSADDLQPAEAEQTDKTGVTLLTSPDVAKRRASGVISSIFGMEKADSSVSVPKTGDPIDLVIIVTVMCIALIVLVILLITKKKDEDDKDDENKKIGKRKSHSDRLNDHV